MKYLIFNFGPFSKQSNRSDGLAASEGISLDLKHTWIYLTTTMGKIISFPLCFRRLYIGKNQYDLSITNRDITDNRILQTIE